jgi:hypothetical protein
VRCESSIAFDRDCSTAAPFAAVTADAGHWIVDAVAAAAAAAFHSDRRDRKYEGSRVNEIGYRERSRCLTAVLSRGAVGVRVNYAKETVGAVGASIDN